MYRLSMMCNEDIKSGISYSRHAETHFSRLQIQAVSQFAERRGYGGLDRDMNANFGEALDGLRTQLLNQRCDSDYVDHSREIECRCCQRCFGSRTA